jgi:hypothetical protein
MLVNQLGQFLRTGSGNQSQGSFLSVRIEEMSGGNTVLGHNSFSPPLQCNCLKIQMHNTFCIHTRLF